MRLISLLLVATLVLGTGGTAAQAQSLKPSVAPSAAAPLPETRNAAPVVVAPEVSQRAESIDTSPAPAPSSSTSLFGMDSAAGVMIGVALMLVFILAIVAVSRNERTMA